MENRGSTLKGRLPCYIDRDNIGKSKIMADNMPYGNLDSGADSVCPCCGRGAAVEKGREWMLRNGEPASLCPNPYFIPFPPCGLDPMF